ncbi:MAG: LysR family transcriptional regulator [Devosia sp.]
MELRHLQHFIAVAEELNFTRAADRVHIVQSALSASVRTLEAELQTPLLVRSTRQVQLTPAGSIFLKRAREALQVIESGRESVADIAGLRRGSLRVGSVHTLPAFMNLSSLIAQYHATNPGIGVRLRQDDTEGLIEALRGGRIDLAFLPLVDPPDGIVARVVACEDLVLVTPKDHQLAHRRGIVWEDLADVPFVDFEVGWGTRPLIDGGFAQMGLARRTEFEVTDLETMVELVSKGLGVALLPETIAASRQSVISVTEVAGPEICWEFVVAYVRGEGIHPVSNAAAAFLELLTFFKELEQAADMRA